MTNITASLVKELREMSGTGMMDCKKALTETGGDIEAAVDWLRKKGLSKAAKKAGRVAAEGLVGVAGKAGIGALVEVNSETDFVARNDKFQDTVAAIAKLALATKGDLSKLQAAKFPGSAHNVEGYVTEMVATIGENMNLRRTAILKVSKGVVADYVHAKVTDGLGKIGVLVALESTGDTEKLMTLGRDLAMQIAAMHPLAVSEDDLDQDVIERERQVFEEQARQSGKPEKIIKQMVEGRLRKEFFQQSVLLQQTYVKGDGKETVAKALKAAEKDIGAPIVVTGFIRFALGDGIDKREDDFADEVAKVAGIN